MTAHPTARPDPQILDALLPHLAWLDDQRIPMVETLRTWAEINSGSDNLAGLEHMATRLRDAFADLGASSERIALPPSAQVTEDGQVGARPHGALLRFTKRPEAPHKILLCIHYDTVFGDDDPFQHCRQLDDDTLNGPGVADAKGGILVILNALLALERSPFRHAVGWEVLLNPDEEIGSPASAPFLAERAADADLGLLYEPALADGTLAGARKGSGNFTVVVRGRAAHAGRDFAQGRNAITALAGFVADLDRLNGQRDGVTLNPGRITGGGPVNIVPDFARLDFNIRLPDADAQRWVEGQLSTLIAALDAQDGIDARLHGGFTRPPKPLSGKTALLFDWAATLGAAIGQPLRWRATGGCCDGNNFAAAGLPNIDTLGVRGGAIHSADEFILLPSLVERAKLSALLLMAIGAGAMPAGLIGPAR